MYTQCELIDGANGDSRTTSSRNTRNARRHIGRYAQWTTESEIMSRRTYAPPDRLKNSSLPCAIETQIVSSVSRLK